MMWTEQNIFEPSGCLSREAFLALLNGELPPEAQAAASRHIGSCPFCSDAIEGFQSIAQTNRQAELLQNIDASFTILERKEKKSSKRRLLWIPLSAAAGLLLILGLFHWFSNPSPKIQLAEQTSTKPAASKVISPENEKSAEKESKPEKQEDKAIASNKKVHQHTSTEDAELRTSDNIKESEATISKAEVADAIEVSDLKVREVVQEKEEIFQQVEQMPEFPGGMDALKNFLATNLKYPKTASEMGISGRVYVKFVVNKKGQISNVTVLRGIGGGCDEEAVRIVKMMPQWLPGKQNGQPVLTYFTLPILFKLNE